MDDLSVFTGNANRPLAASICKHLRIPLGDADVFQFSNENIFVKINDNVRGRDVFVIQPFSFPVNRSIMELLIMIDALKRAGYKHSQVATLKKAYQILYRSGLKLQEALARIETEIPTAETLHLVTFIRRSERGICRE